jgi:hypothetical protein
MTKIERTLIIVAVYAGLMLYACELYLRYR